MQTGENLHDTLETILSHVGADELHAHGHHKKLEHLFLLLRNISVALAVIFFLTSTFWHEKSHLFKSIGYFLGALAYLSEILLLTDFFRQKVPYREMFMAYCFGPLYVILGFSYLIAH